MVVDVSIKNCKIVSPEGIFSAGVAIDDGKIVAVAHDQNLPQADKVIDAKGNYLIPGVVDPHSHIAVGKFENAKQMLGDFYRTESGAAAAGGVTTLFSTTTWVPADETAKLVDQNAMTDMSFHAEATSLEKVQRSAAFGISSFKLHMISYPRYGVNAVDDGHIYLALEAVRDLGYPAIVMAHCEDMSVINKITERVKKEGRTDPVAWTDARPNFTEEGAIRRVMFLAEVLNAPFYIPHLTIKEGVSLVAKQKAKGFNVIAETCPHYLTLTKHEEKGWLAKVLPPLRAKEDVEALWKGIRDGVIECIGSDHVLWTKEMKNKLDHWDPHNSGFPGTETLLPVMLSEGVNKGRITFERLVQVCCANPAKAFGLFPKKGTIRVGSDADLAIVDLNKEVTVTPDILHSSSDFSIYEGWKFKGWPVMTILRGNVMMKEGELVGKPGYGKFLPRKVLVK
jgi:D-hydantoinase